MMGVFASGTSSSTKTMFRSAIILVLWYTLRSDVIGSTFSKENILSVLADVLVISVTN